MIFNFGLVATSAIGAVLIFGSLKFNDQKYLTNNQLWFIRLKKSYVSKKEIQSEIRLREAFKSSEFPLPSQGPTGAAFRDYSVAGNMLLEDPDFGKILDLIFGIKQSFIGIGRTMPSEKFPVGIAEYLVKNRADNYDQVAVLKFSSKGGLPTQMSKTVSEIVLDKTALIGQNKDIVSSRLDLINDSKMDADTPILIRFHLIDENIYSGMLGRKEAEYVFFCKYDDVKDKSVSDALRASGLEYRDPADAPELYVWIYFPNTSQQIIEATWKNVFQLLEDGVKPGGWWSMRGQFKESMP